MATEKQYRNKWERWPTVGKRTMDGGVGLTTAYALRPPHYALTYITRKQDTSLVTQVWLRDKPCRVTVDTGAYVTLVRPDIAAEWPEREPILVSRYRLCLGNPYPFRKKFCNL
jgi:protocatechuate 3,4-dioxygenase beta subunit